MASASIASIQEDVRRQIDPALLVGVRCRLGNRLEELALLDTGAQFSVISSATARIIHDRIEDLDESILFLTRFGRKDARVHRMNVALLADPDLGIDLEVDATVAVIKDWSGPTVLGFQGFFERVRIALDPDDANPLFHFGELGAP